MESNIAKKKNVCGYLLRKVLKWHNCVDCDMMLHDFEHHTDSLSVYF